MDGHNRGIIPLLSHHLQLLNTAYSVFRIEHDDPGPRNICKSCHSCLTSISGRCCQDHDLLICMILLRCSCHKVREDGQCHILKSNGTSVEQLQIICAISLYQRRNGLCIEFAIICFLNTVF